MDVQSITGGTLIVAGLGLITASSDFPDVTTKVIFVACGTGLTVAGVFMAIKGIVVDVAKRLAA